MTETKISVIFAVGANCVRTREFTERPYEFVFSTGKTCFMEDTPCGCFSLYKSVYLSRNILYHKRTAKKIVAHRVKRRKSI